MPGATTSATGRRSSSQGVWAMLEYTPAIEVATMPATRPAMTRAFFRASGSAITPPSASFA